MFKTVLFCILQHCKNFIFSRKNIIAVSLSVLIIFTTSAIINGGTIKDYQYCSAKVSEKNEIILIRQKQFGENFIQNNDFYIGYEFNYLYSTPKIKTFFKTDDDNEKIFESIWFSSNTGMTSVDYLAPNIMGLKVKEGKPLSNDWNENDIYVSESYYYELFNKNGLDSDSKISIGNNLLNIVGIIEEKSIYDFIDFYSNTFFVFFSYKYALKNIEKYSVDTLFKGKDVVGSNRYLHHYFNRYSSSIDDDRMIIYEKGLSNPEIIKHNYTHIPLLEIIIIVVSIISLIITGALCHKELIELRYIDSIRFLLFFILIRLLFNILSGIIFKNTQSILSLPISVVISSLIGIGFGIWIYCFLKISNKAKKINIKEIDI